MRLNFLVRLAKRNYRENKIGANKNRGINLDRRDFFLSLLLSHTVSEINC